jgi:hypothetical protein
MTDGAQGGDAAAVASARSANPGKSLATARSRNRILALAAPWVVRRVRSY